jgi:hypothetical protein
LIRSKTGGFAKDEKLYNNPQKSKNKASRCNIFKLIKIAQK